VNTLFGPTSGATLSPCGLYRYSLWRKWDESQPLCTWIMLNPSTADASKDDPTIRRCIGYSKRWGFGGLLVANLFALRATDPRVLQTAPDPVGPENDAYLLNAASNTAKVVCAWGNWGDLRGRSEAVCRLLQGVPLYRLGLTELGEPSHPLYLPSSLEPVPYVRGKKP
jgi:hypothetical protein